MKIVVISLVLGICLTCLSNNIVKVVTLNSPAIDISKAEGADFKINDNYYFSAKHFVRIISKECDAICLNEVGFPLTIHTAPREHNILDEINLINLLINFLIYTIFSFITILGVSKIFVFLNRKNDKKQSDEILKK